MNRRGNINKNQAQVKFTVADSVEGATVGGEIWLPLPGADVGVTGDVLGWVGGADSVGDAVVVAVGAEVGERVGGEEIGAWVVGAEVGEVGDAVGRVVGDAVSGDHPGGVGPSLPARAVAQTSVIRAPNVS